MSADRVFLRSIAEQAGVSVATVSRALRNDREISKATATRIQVLARQLGYRPDPALTALAAYRSGRNPRHRYGRLAALAHWTGDAPATHISEILEGIRSRAGQLGFEIEVHNLPANDLEQTRLSRKLEYQGIRGVIVTPLPLGPDGFLWRRFSVVGIGENAMPLQINYVSYDHDHALQETYRELRLRGYRNIGFLNSLESEERNRFLFVASYLKCLYRDGRPPAEPYLYQKDRDRLIPWIREQGHDAVLTNGTLRNDLIGTKFDSPERLGVAAFVASSLKAAEDRLAAYVVDGSHLGTLAVDFLQSLMQKNQTGIPAPSNQYSMHIRGSWREDSTVRPREVAGTGETGKSLPTRRL